MKTTAIARKHKNRERSIQRRQARQLKSQWFDLHAKNDTIVTKLVQIREPEPIKIFCRESRCNNEVQEESSICCPSCEDGYYIVLLATIVDILMHRQCKVCRVNIIVEMFFLLEQADSNLEGFLRQYKRNCIHHSRRLIREEKLAEMFEEQGYEDPYDCYYESNHRVRHVKKRQYRHRSSKAKQLLAA